MSVEKLRVLLVSNDGNEGGVANVIRQLLKIEECAFCVVCGSPGPFADSLAAEGRDVRVLDFGGSLRSLAPYFSLAKLIRDFRPHVVHSHHPRAYLRGRVSACVCRVPHISTPHSSLLDELARRPDLRPWRMKLLLTRERMTAPFDAFTIALSDYQKFMLVRLGTPEGRIRVIPNGVDLELFPVIEEEANSEPRDSIKIGTIGRVTFEKGMGDLLEAFAQLPSSLEGLPLELLVVGDGSDRPKLEEKAIALGIAARVRWLGHRTDVAILWRMVDVAVFPSRYEGMPLALIEAMAAGRTIVAVDLPVFEKVLAGDCGLCVPRDRLANGILTALTSRSMAYRLARNARSKAEREYDVRRVLRQTAQLYRDVAGNLN